MDGMPPNDSGPPEMDEPFMQQETLFNAEAEQALLGAIFVDNEALNEALEKGLKPEMFALTAHARIFDAMLRLNRRGRVADPTTLKPYFQADDSLEEIGGSKYLAHIAASAINVINAPEYARIIVDFHMKRQITDVCRNYMRMLTESDIDDTAESIGAEMESAVAALLNGVQSNDDAVSLERGLGETYDDLEYAIEHGLPPGIATGLYDLDRIIGGLEKGNFYLLAGRPSMGKTACALSVARNIARRTDSRCEWTAENGKKVLFISMEMPKKQVHHRLISMQARVAVEKLRKVKDLTQSEIQKVREVRSEVEGLTLFISDTERQSINEVRSKARRLQRKHGLDVVIIDYLGLMKMDDRYKGDRNNEVGNISAGLKSMAKALNIPVVALQQLNRGVEQREDKRPTLADLRDSGSLEQDADVVMFVYRDEYYLEKAEPKQRDGETTEKFNDRLEHWTQRLEQAKGKAEVIVAKHRNGPLGIAHVRFAGWLTEYQNAAHEQ